MNEPKAALLMQRFSLGAHPENGMFVEKHYPHEGPARAASGSIYYYVAPGERTRFHRIDCDEYWIFNCGAPLDIWVVTLDGRTEVRRLGIEEGCEPLAYLQKGEIFASRSRVSEDGTFLTCVTVPRFHYAGFEMFDDDAILRRFPALKPFFED